MYIRNKTPNVVGLTIQTMKIKTQIPNVLDLTT